VWRAPSERGSGVAVRISSELGPTERGSLDRQPPGRSTWTARWADSCRRHRAMQGLTGAGMLPRGAGMLLGFSLKGRRRPPLPRVPTPPPLMSTHASPGALATRSASLRGATKAQQAIVHASPPPPPAAPGLDCHVPIPVVNGDLLAQCRHMSN
jgi:hypothetical protein